MCGINGILAFKDGPPVSVDNLIAMRDTLAHRGPDGVGIWVDSIERVGLAHRRLTILDLTLIANQPMSDKVGSVIVSFNGEIYNHNELRLELIGLGQEFFTTNSDTEVLVNGYKQWGWDGLLKHIRGMFAIALWDARERCLYLARDRLGIKPLYIQWTEKGVLFASEIKAILKVSTELREIDYFAMYHYLSGMVAPAPMTMFRGVQKIPAGSYLRITEDGTGSFQQYWHPTSGVDKVTFNKREAAVEYIRSIFPAVVAEQMAADVPVGVLLSGGVDSTTILASMVANGAQDVHTYSVGYKDFPELDERQNAKKVAEQFGSIHHEIVITEEDLINSMQDIVFHQDEPISDWVCFPLFHVAKLASKDVKVVLVGEGADEVFTGYEGYIRYIKLHKKYWTPYQKFISKGLRICIARVAEFLARKKILGLSGLDFLIRSSRGKEFFWGGAATFWESDKRNLLAATQMKKSILPHNASPLNDEMLRILDSNSVMLDAAWGLPENTSSLTRMTNLELHYRLPELLLMRVDKMTMAYSIEARVPFLDHRIVQAAFDLPVGWKLKNGLTKSLLKDAVQGLIPDDVIRRPKIGFGAPVSHWLKGQLGAVVEKEIKNSKLFLGGWFDMTYIHKMFEAHRAGEGDYGPNLWTLYNLALWHKMWIEEDLI